MTEAAAIRKLWERVEKDGLLRVVQVIQGPKWTLLVSVPWCRFAREISTEAQYRELLERLRRQPAAPPAVRSDETQLELFGDPQGSLF